MKTANAVVQGFARGVARTVSRVRVRGIPRAYFFTAPWVLGDGLRLQESVSGIRIPINATEYPGCMMFYGRFSIRLLGLAFVTRRQCPGYWACVSTSQHLAVVVGASGNVSCFEPDPNDSALTQIIS